MVTLYREWSRNLNDRTGCFLPENVIEDICKYHRDPGYTSVYSFDEAAAEEIKRVKSSKGLSKYCAYSTNLIIDIDGTDLDAARGYLADIERRLTELDLGYDVWFSGGKGFHVVLKHDLLKSAHLPHSHEMFLESIGIKSDYSLYRHGSLISLPGCVHRRTKIKKHLLKTVEGNLVTIPIVEKPVIEYDIQSDLSQMEALFFRLLAVLSKPPDIGNRHTTLWGLGKDLKRLGLSFCTAVELLQKVNEKWENKKTEDEVTQAIEQAYSR
jgi:hypothetical protein